MQTVKDMLKTYRYNILVPIVIAMDSMGSFAVKESNRGYIGGIAKKRHSTPLELMLYGMKTTSLLMQISIWGL